MMSLTHKAAEVFANDLYATQATGVRFVEVGEDYAKCTLDIQPIHRNAMGGVMGGVLFTLADLAFAAAANSRNIAAGESLSWVTLSVDKLISLSDSQHINISTKNISTQSIKTGRNSCVFNINLYDGNQTLISIVTTEGRRVSIV